ncbi:MFS transporter [Nonomuraea salmonea]|uniref:MFS transporter n=1 Tax=Nonomuraea salmonea TaxID=46181 RepID=UPI002FE72DAC
MSKARVPWKAVLGGSVGNLVEWYDWFVYSSFAVYFAASFFPEGDTTAKLLNTAAIFAVGFFMRPLGGWLLGRYADRKGRKAALTLTVTLMSASALLIAVAPPRTTRSVTSVRWCWWWPACCRACRWAASTRPAPRT